MTASPEFATIRVPELRWQFSKIPTPRFELTHQGLLSATLEHVSMPRNGVLCRCSEGEWVLTFEMGWSKDTATIESLRDNKTVVSWSSTSPYPEKLTFADSREFTINPSNGLAHKIEVLDELSERLLLYRPTDMSLANIFHTEATVEVTYKGQIEPHLPALIFFVWQAVLWRGAQASG